MERSALIDACRTEDVCTYNGALTNNTSLSSVIDLFFLAGASRTMSEQDIRMIITRAIAENTNLALKCIFWAGDIRQGAGERRFFKIALNLLAEQYPTYFDTLVSQVPEFSRFDVLFKIPRAFPYICKEFSKALANEPCNGLFFKWLPRKKQYDNLSSKLIKHFKLTPKQYRQILVKNTKVVEQDMCSQKWGDIEYSHVPSVAMHRYTKAFQKHDESRFVSYIAACAEGKSKINASAIFPHDIIGRSIASEGSCLSAAEIAQWNALPNWLEGSVNSLLPICDVSGSMYGLPIMVSVSLGLYISERNEGVFKDAFVTFSNKPTMQYLAGDLSQRIQSLCQADWSMNTNLEAVFELLLNKAIENKLPEEHMPKNVLIISDMEFDEAVSGTTLFKAIESKYASAGYTRPNVVFWNVNGRTGNVPISIKDSKTALISGFSPSIIRSILSGDVSPVSTMLRTLNVPRYSAIEV